MIAGERTIVAPSVSAAWADAFSLLVDSGDHDAINLTIRIADPLSEEAPIRALADGLAGKLGLQDIAEVANTIYPSEWALDLPEPGELARDYREHYPFLRSLGSPTGTYFGRLVAYPDPETGDTIDQLSDCVAKLRDSQARGQVFRSVYELNVYCAAVDRKKLMGFPCLAHIGLHIGVDERVHAVAKYRSHDVLEKGYGNYLGLGGLLGYVARAAGREPGELLVVAGRAFFAGGVGRLRGTRQALERF